MRRSVGVGIYEQGLAEIISIASKDEDISSSMERIRHWTGEGLLTPIGEKNPGTGRKRFTTERGCIRPLSSMSSRTGA